jgi:hypothetical protein
MFLNRIPTDVCIHWIDILQKNYNHPSAGKNKDLLLGILKARKLQWMTHNLTIEAMKNSLKKDSDTLRQAGLPILANIAYNKSTLANDCDCLYKHLPINNDYEHTKNLLANNMYGAVFESFWIDVLVERRDSQSLFLTMEKIGHGLSKLFHGLDNKLRNLFLDKLIEELKIESNSRFWHRNTSGLQQVINGSNYDLKSKALDSILKRRINTGFDAILVPYLTITIFLAYGRTLTSGGKPIPEWLKANQSNYFNIITTYRKNNGRNYLTPSGNGKHVTTSGITQIHHPPTNPQSSTLKFRWTLDRKPNLSGGFSTTLLEHGLPYAGGVSGSANIIAGTLSHLIKDLNVRIDAKEAILGAIMFLVYEGGHSIHEVLWTLYERELQNQHYLSFGLQLVPPGEKPPLRGLFISNYEHFIKMYQGSETGLVLSEARNDAWQKTLQYFNKYSTYKNLFAPTIAQIPTKPSHPPKLAAQNPAGKKKSP